MSNGWKHTTSIQIIRFSYLVRAALLNALLPRAVSERYSRLYQFDKLSLNLTTLRNLGPEHSREATVNRFDRVTSLLLMLQTRSVVTAQFLADHFGVTERAIYRKTERWRTPVCRLVRRRASGIFWRRDIACHR